ncbi:ankyrin repeat protein [Thermovibrio guaymasensis]|uniref:Ankyrin repeat protein n=1 Tax=Thermovibrio guaymasensis TaxID=240167 RepID=A0A420W778_9BACT|nr:ankyrin repeat domain-containing protein [Thermovibrio guaymasensis]RKQ63180.1 ankyrin repeat protein [Thermovibrio guaymasensis]
MKRVLTVLLAANIVLGAPAIAGTPKGVQQLKVDRKVKREFFLSLRSGDFKKAEELIASGKIPVDFRNKFNQTPLFYAVNNDNVEFAKFLVKHGANVNAKDFFGITPLHQAVISGSYKVAKFLIKNGAEVNAKDNYGYTPLHLAAIYNRPKIAKLLIENGADVNAKDNYGNTPLHYCGTTFGTAPTAKVLLENGADPTIKNKRGKTPLQLANEVKNYPVARLITKYLKRANQ